ncbi:MAG TPA: PD-(D/E)XK motif protein [Sulfurovum sp.]|nr:PD-(D/E)XK motif protein [Sulfurovum sp.]
MMKSNPWNNIERSESNIRLNGILADKSHLLEFYWAKDSFGNLLFVLNAASEIIVNSKIPQLNGIEISIGKHDRNNQLVFTLASEEDKYMFHTLCKDLIESTKDMKDEEYAIKTVLKRLEKWQYFLKSRRKIIDKRQLKGLIGELLFLEHYLLKNYDAEDALTFWRAPLQSVQDFEFSSFAVEVKTKSSVNSITISAYEQLFSELDHLLLYVATLNDSTDKTPEAFNIYDLIDKIRDDIKTKNSILEEKFNNLLVHYGFIELEEYREYYFLFITDEFYEVTEDFPKISTLPDGVESLTYRINLDKCKAFLADKEILIKAGINNE